MALLDGIIQQSETELFDLPAWREEWQIDAVEFDQLQHAGLYMLVDGQRISLQQGGKKAPGPVFVDFVSGALAGRFTTMRQRAMASA